MKYRILRLGAFVATSLSGFAPILHAMTIFPYDQLDKQAGIRYYYLEAVFYLTGAIIYGVRLVFSCLVLSSLTGSPIPYLLSPIPNPESRKLMASRSVDSLPREMEAHHLRRLGILASNLPLLRRAGRHVSFLRCHVRV